MVTDMKEKPIYAKGDRVLIVTDLKTRNHPPGINDEMFAVQGQEFVIKTVPLFKGGIYSLVGSPWY